MNLSTINQNTFGLIFFGFCALMALLLFTINIIKLDVTKKRFWFNTIIIIYTIFFDLMIIVFLYSSHLLIFSLPIILMSLFTSWKSIKNPPHCKHCGAMKRISFKPLQSCHQCGLNYKKTSNNLAV